MSLKSVIKLTLFGASGALGLQAALRHAHRRRLMVLCYHGVIERDHSRAGVFARHAYRNSVARAEFDRQMTELRRKYTPVSLAAVEAWVIAGEPLPDRAVLVTFDDGYQNNLTHALPILRRHEIPAVVSVTTDYIGTDRLLWPTEVELRVGHNSAVPEPGGTTRRVPPDPSGRRAVVDAIRTACKLLPVTELASYLDVLRGETDLPSEAIDRELVAFLDWDGVRELAAGGVTIASHTASHPILTRLSPDALSEELASSKQKIETELGTECSCLVYPNGGREDYSPAVVAAVEAAGYRLAFRLMNGRNPVADIERFAIDRVDVPGQVAPSAFDVRACGLFSRLAGTADR